VLLLSDTDQALLATLTLTAQSLRDAGDLAVMREWVETLSEHECTLLVQWAQHHATASQPAAPTNGKYAD
jgi:hypothetical protein